MVLDFSGMVSLTAVDPESSLLICEELVLEDE